VDARRRKGHRECVCIVLVTMVRYLCGEALVSGASESLAKWRIYLCGSLVCCVVRSICQEQRTESTTDSLSFTVYREPRFVSLVGRHTSSSTRRLRRRERDLPSSTS
jgi:bacteriorhodopsin